MSSQMCPYRCRVRKEREGGVVGLGYRYEGGGGSDRLGKGARLGRRGGQGEQEWIETGEGLCGRAAKFAPSASHPLFGWNWSGGLGE